MQNSLVFVAVILIALAAVLLERHKRKQSGPSRPEILPREITAKPELKEPSETVSQIVIVDSTSQPIVTIQNTVTSDAYQRASPVDHNNGIIARLSAMVQAAPALMAASSAQGKQLMEVVINGDLVRAADGNGLRAIAMGPNGIKEHARLFEVKGLENMVNAAAIWQIASVVVAQKHLADISKKLDEIKVGVQELSNFLNEERRSRIEGTYDYLHQAYMATQAGGLSPAIRTEIEACERDLAEILRHLRAEYHRIVDTKVEHKETVGTEDLTTDIVSKLERLEQVGRDIELCLKTRIAAWHVLSLYPGEAHVILARRKSIERSIADVEDLAPHLVRSLDEEISGVNSFWNQEATLNERRLSLKARLSQAHEALAKSSQSATVAVEKSDTLLLIYDQPTRLWLSLENGIVTEALVETL